MSCTVDHMGGCCHLYDKEVEDETKASLFGERNLTKYSIMVDNEYIEFESAEEGLVYLQQELQEYKSLWATQKKTITNFQEILDIMEEKEKTAQEEIETLVEENEALLVEKTIDSEKVSTGPKRDWTHEEVEMLKQDFQEDIRNMKYSLNEAGEFIGEILTQIGDMKQNYS